MNEIEWHEVPGNPGGVLIGKDDFYIPVYCEPGEKTEWAVIPYWPEFCRLKNGYKLYTNLYGTEMVIREDPENINSQIIGNFSIANYDCVEIHVKKEQIAFVPIGLHKKID